jgi:hypothetical protein
MSKRVQVVILCEDDQQENFARTYLKSRGKQLCYVVKCPAGKGDAARFVSARYPAELEARRRDSVHRSLAVILDEDTLGVARRQKQLDDCCREEGIDPRRADDRVGIFIPARNIETWLRYLEGQEVNDTKDYSPRGSHKPISCKFHIERLGQLCVAGALPEAAPPQLKAACGEVGRIL